MSIDNTCPQPQDLLAQAAKRPSKRERRAVKLGFPVLLCLLFGTVLCLALLYVGQRSHLMTLTYQFEALQKRVADALREQEFIELQIAQANSLVHVERVATGKLGMVRPDSRQFVVLEPTQIDVYPAGQEETPQDRGLIALALDWVSRRLPRTDTAEAGGEPK